MQLKNAAKPIEKDPSVFGDVGVFVPHTLYENYTKSAMKLKTKMKVL